MATHPRIGQIEATGATDGDVPVFDADAGRLVMGPAGLGLGSVIVTVVNGVPMLMFDDDSSPVTTEVPS